MGGRVERPWGGAGGAPRGLSAHRAGHVPAGGVGDARRAARVAAAAARQRLLGHAEVDHRGVGGGVRRHRGVAAHDRAREAGRAGDGAPGAALGAVAVAELALAVGAGRGVAVRVVLRALPAAGHLLLHQAAVDVGEGLGGRAIVELHVGVQLVVGVARVVVVVVVVHHVAVVVHVVGVRGEARRLGDEERQDDAVDHCAVGRVLRAQGGRSIGWLPGGLARAAR